MANRITYQAVSLERMDKAVSLERMDVKAITILSSHIQLPARYARVWWRNSYQFFSGDD